MPSPLRIRAINDEYTLTKKFVLGENKGQLEEVTLPLKKSEFKVLFLALIRKFSKPVILFVGMVIRSILMCLGEA